MSFVIASMSSAALGKYIYLISPPFSVSNTSTYVLHTISYNGLVFQNHSSDLRVLKFSYFCAFLKKGNRVINRFSMLMLVCWRLEPPCQNVRNSIMECLVNSEAMQYEATVERG
jgi:hypothetical protein